MKKNTLAAIIVLVLGVIAAWFYRNKTSSTIKPALRDFAVQDTAAITKIFLADFGGKQVTLTKTVEGMWMVNGKYPARKDAIQTLLYTINKLDVKDQVGKNARANQIKYLSSSGIKTEIYAGEKLIRLYYVGGETQDGTGTYMLLADPETRENSSLPFVMYIPGFQGYLTTRYFTDELMWRSLGVLNLLPSQIQRIRLESLKQPEKNFELRVNGKNDFSLVSPGTGLPAVFDTSIVKQYLTYFRNLNAESYVTGKEMKTETMDSLRRARPEFTLTVTDEKGETRVLKAHRRNVGKGGFTDIDGDKLDYDPERMYALINNDRDIITIQVYSFGKVFMPIDYFVPREKPVKK